MRVAPDSAADPAQAPPPDPGRTPVPAAPDSLGVVMRQPLFRRMWLASLLSSMGLMIQGVGAAWTMTQLTPAADLVALVQTAQMAPVMLFALAAGAVADMYDRRRVVLVALVIAASASAVLAVLAYLELLNPAMLLSFCFIVGSGTALLWPALTASVSEQVPPENLAPAVALNSISYNVARSLGPAIGGMIVAAAGAMAAFGAAVLLYAPLFVVMYLWRRVQPPSRFPPESLSRAIISGVRYIGHSPSLRIVLIRTLATATVGGSLVGLMPLVARELLHGDATTFGLSLGAFGIGAVIGAMNIPRIRRRLSAEATVWVCTLIMAASTAIVALSAWAGLTWLALMFAGGAWMVAANVFNIVIQLAAPRWVAARAIAAFQACMACGVAVGSWGWGAMAEALSLKTALLVSASGLLVLPLLGFWFRVPSAETQSEDAEALSDPDVRLAVTARSGPILIEIEYRVDAAEARTFYKLMQEVRLSRNRNGGYGWSLSRDLGDPRVWIEAYSCPTWLDYLRQRNRATQAERELQRRAEEYHIGPEPIQVRRRLERPFGSVRWKEEAPDRPVDPLASSQAPAVGS